MPIAPDAKPNGNLSTCSVAINWRIYTASGHIHKPSGEVKKAYTIPLADDALVNRHVKSIVQPKYVWAVVNPHYASYDLNCKAVNEHYQEVKGPFSLFANLNTMLHIVHILLIIH